MNAFQVLAGILALWAVIVSVLGITREDFPGSAGAARAVAAVSILLVAATIFGAIYVGVTEKKDEGGKETGALSLL